MMNSQDVSKLAKDLQNDKSFQEELSGAETVQETLKVVRSNGYNVSIDEVKEKYTNNEQENGHTSIGDDLVENVADGNFPQVNGCPCNSCLSVYVTS